MTACIYVVDDDPVVQEAIGGYLASVGFAVSCFSSVKDFRTAVRQRLPDIVISDIIIPGEDGLTLLRWFREFSEAPVIMLSSQGTTTDRVVGLELGADDYLVKPRVPQNIDLERLAENCPRLRGKLGVPCTEETAKQYGPVLLFNGSRGDGIIEAERKGVPAAH